MLRHLGMAAGSIPAPPRPTVVSIWAPSAGKSGFWYPAKDLAEPVAAGEALGEIRDVFGNVEKTVRSERGGFVLCRLSSLAVNQGEALLGVGTPLEGG